MVTKVFHLQMGGNPVDHCKWFSSGPVWQNSNPAVLTYLLGNPRLKVTPNSKAGTRKEKTMGSKPTIMAQFALGGPVFRTEWFWEEPSLPVWLFDMTGCHSSSAS